jgi:hypothetical protein
MRAVLLSPSSRSILLFQGEKAFNEGRFNALLIICKDVRLPMYYHTTWPTQEFVYVTRNENLVLPNSSSLKKMDLAFSDFVNCQKAVDLLIAVSYYLYVRTSTQSYWVVVLFCRMYKLISYFSVKFKIYKNTRKILIDKIASIIFDNASKIIYRAPAIAKIWRFWVAEVINAWNQKQEIYLYS